MATLETAWKKTDGPVRYHGGEISVELGDRVDLRGWFRTRSGVVNYVPGLSKPHPQLEYDGLHEVGVACDNGTFTAILVDPDTGCTLKGLTFVSRGGDAALPVLPSDDDW